MVGMDVRVCGHCVLLCNRGVCVRWVSRTRLHGHFIAPGDVRMSGLVKYLWIVEKIPRKPSPLRHINLCCQLKMFEHFRHLKKENLSRTFCFVLSRRKELLGIKLNSKAKSPNNPPICLTFSLFLNHWARTWAATSRLTAAYSRHLIPNQ